VLATPPPKFVVDACARAVRRHQRRVHLHLGLRAAVPRRLVPPRTCLGLSAGASGYSWYGRSFTVKVVAGAAEEEKGEEERKRPRAVFVSLPCDVEAYRFCWGLAIPSSSLGRKRREGQDKASGIGFLHRIS
jgi:hypothetical protein